MGQMEDVSKALTLEPRSAGDELYLLGDTADELGASEWSRLRGIELAEVPRSELSDYDARYDAFCRARDAGLVRSAHALGLGGLGTALAHTAMSTPLRVQVELGCARLTSWARRHASSRRAPVASCSAPRPTNARPSSPRWGCTV